MQKTEEKTAKQCPANTGKEKGKKDYVRKAFKVLHCIYTVLSLLDKALSKISEYFDWF